MRVEGSTMFELIIEHQTFVEDARLKEVETTEALQVAELVDLTLVPEAVFKWTFEHGSDVVQRFELELMTLP